MAISLFKSWKKILIFFLATIFLIALAVYFWLISLSPGTTDPFTDSNGEIIQGSVAEAVDLEIGGIEQFVLTRGKSVDNPILLFFMVVLEMLKGIYCVTIIKSLKITIPLFIGIKEVLVDLIQKIFL